MVEIDEEIAAFWELILNGKNKWLAKIYSYFDIDHERLFKLTAQLQGKFMLTYDDAPEIRKLADKYNLQYRTIPMKTTLHFEKNEITIGRVQGNGALL